MLWAEASSAAEEKVLLGAFADPGFWAGISNFLSALDRMIAFPHSFSFCLLFPNMQACSTDIRM